VLLRCGEGHGLYNILSKSPKSFSAQAKKKSLDKETAKKGGDLGFVLEDQLPPQITKEAILLNKGQMSKPISLADKWVLIKLEDKRDAKIAKFEDAKASLVQSLSTKALQDFISNNLKEAKISVVVK
jgi:parvulin-like peptidyl-prolyl isomerase